MDGFGRVISIILVSILIIVLPLKGLVVQYNKYIENHLEESTKELAIEIMENGYLTLDRYEQYLKNLKLSKDLYKIDFVHSIPKEGIERLDRKNYNEKIRNTRVEYLSNLSTIKPHNEEESSFFHDKTPISLVVTSFEDVIVNGSTPSFELYLYYDDETFDIISQGYTMEGLTPGPGIKEITFTYDASGLILTDTITIEVIPYMKTCERGHSYQLDQYNNDYGCPICIETMAEIEVHLLDSIIEKGEELKAYLTVRYLDGHSQVVEEGFTYDFNSEILGSQEVTFYYKGMYQVINVTVIENLICSICGSRYSSQEEGEDPFCPTCSRMVVEILVDPNFYTLSLGENLDLDLTATFLNGKKEKVEGWTSNFNPNKPGLQQVMVYYKNIVTSIEVFVESEHEIACRNCNFIYNKIEYPSQCPLCSNLIIGIEVSLESSGKVIIGKELDPLVVLLFYNGERELAREGWEIIGYDPYKLGIQSITIVYEEFEANLLIEVVEFQNINLCDQEHYYFIDPKEENLACPYCRDNQLDTELIQSYQEAYFTEDILKELYSNGVYYFRKGDYFTIKIILESSFPDSFNLILKLPRNKYKYSYGGIIHGKFF